MAAGTSNRDRLHHETVISATDSVMSAIVCSAAPDASSAGQGTRFGVQMTDEVVYISIVEVTSVGVLFAAVVVGLFALIQPSTAEACSCAGTASSAVAFDAADIVFVGTVARIDPAAPWYRLNPDGSLTGRSGADPTTATFRVRRIFRGGRMEAVILTGSGTTCDEPFQTGESWLVYANWGPGGTVTTHKCTRTRLRADAAQDLVYLEGMEQGRQQGIAYGEVLRAIVGTDGRPASQALFERLQVIAAGLDLRFETTTEQWGAYQIVLPPGDFELWVERARRIVGSKQIVHIEDRTNRHLQLVVNYRD
jgi:hypothetical protein